MNAPVVAGTRVSRAVGRLCPYCNVRMGGKPNRPASPTREHTNPRVKGGGPVIISCRRCNQDKGDRTIREWADYLQTRKGDYRWKIVTALANNLEAGRLKFVTDDVVGLAPGIFA